MPDLNLLPVDKESKRRLPPPNDTSLLYVYSNTYLLLPKSQNVQRQLSAAVHVFVCTCMHSSISCICILLHIIHQDLVYSKFCNIKNVDITLQIILLTVQRSICWNLNYINFDNLSNIIGSCLHMYVYMHYYLVLSVVWCTDVYRCVDMCV